MGRILCVYISHVGHPSVCHLYIAVLTVQCVGKVAFLCKEVVWGSHLRRITDCHSWTDPSWFISPPLCGPDATKVSRGHTHSATPVITLPFSNFVAQTVYDCLTIKKMFSLHCCCSVFPLSFTIKILGLRLLVIPVLSSHTI